MRYLEDTVHIAGAGVVLNADLFYGVGIGRVLIDSIGLILSHQIVRVDMTLKVEGGIAADRIGLSGQVLQGAGQVEQAKYYNDGRQEPHHRLKPDLEPPQQGTVALIQSPAQLLRVTHSQDSRRFGLLRGQVGVKFQQGVLVVLQVGGEFGGDGVVVGREADKGAHLPAKCLAAIGGHTLTSIHNGWPRIPVWVTGRAGLRRRRSP